jgi:hypothetical protein
MAVDDNTQISALLVETTRKTELEPVFKFFSEYIKKVDARAGDRVFRAAAVSVVSDMLNEVDADAFIFLSDEMSAWLGTVGDLELLSEIESFVSVIKPVVDIDAAVLDDFVCAWDELAVNEHDEDANSAAISVSINLHQSINRH